MQDISIDTVESNAYLGLLDNNRSHSISPSTLKDLDIKSAQLMTNNHCKVNKLKRIGMIRNNYLRIPK